MAKDKETNRQYKKWTYTTQKGFDTYSPDIIKRWGRFYNMIVEKQLNDEWVDIDFEPVNINDVIDTEPEDEDLELSGEDVGNILADLDAFRDYANSEIHSRCDYDIYSYVIDKLDALERVFQD